MIDRAEMERLPRQQPVDAAEPGQPGEKFHLPAFAAQLRGGLLEVAAEQRGQDDRQLFLPGISKITQVRRRKEMDQVSRLPVVPPTDPVHLGARAFDPTHGHFDLRLITAVHQREGLRMVEKNFHEWRGWLAARLPRDYSSCDGARNPSARGLLFRFFAL